MMMKTYTGVIDKSTQTESLEAAFLLDSKCGKVRADNLSLELGLKSQAVCQVDRQLVLSQAEDVAARNY
jgi:hypothetical protein